MVLGMIGWIKHARRSSHLSLATKPAAEPRKRPVQARSAATVDAILEATIQVLLAMGKERLTTTQVAMRAGVSVGTLYQYFPNKRALLKASLTRHMDEVERALAEVCVAQRSAGLLEMATALIEAYLGAKMRDVRASATLYAVSSDVEGTAIAKAAGLRSRKNVAALLATAKEGLAKDPEVVASVVLAALNGVARRVLEAQRPEREMEALRGELMELVRSYLVTCAATPRQ
jgi:AcrR family transcriptional regulator